MRLQFDREHNAISVDVKDLTNSMDYQEVASLVQQIHKTKYGGELPFTAVSMKLISEEAKDRQFVVIRVTKERVVWNFSGSA